MAFKALKTISKTDTELRVENHIILFNSRDAEVIRKGPNPDGSFGEYFDPSVDVESPYTKSGRLLVDFEHREGEFGDDILGSVDWSTAHRDDEGILVQRILDRRNKYVKLLEPLIEAGLIGNSSEAHPRMVKTKDDGGIIKWGLMRDTLTVTPAETKMLKEYGENVMVAMKSLSSVIPAAKTLLDSWQVKQTGDQSGQPEGGAGKATAGTSRVITGRKSLPTREKTMDILEAIKKLVPGLSPEQLEQIAAIMGLTGMGVATGDESLVDEGGKPIKSVKMSDLVSELKKLGYPVVLPGQQMVKKAIQRPIMEKSAVTGTKEADGLEADEDPEMAQRKKSIESAYFMKYANESDAKKAIMTDLIGKDYPLILNDQQKAYAKYVRFGDKNLDASEFKSLKKMYFPAEKVAKLIIDEGYEVKTIKAVQVEAIGQLGGFAAPPMVQSAIDSRLPGTTGVRGGGAEVIELVDKNSIDIPIYVGNSDSYMGTMRGSFGNESADPEEQGFELEEETVVAEIYTYKVKLTQSQVEDQANLISKVNEDIISTCAIDEDFVCATGNGVRKPLGILPDGANFNSLTVVLTGDADELTYDGIRKMKRGVPGQYRKDAVWLGKSDTYGDIEAIKFTGSGEPAFPDLTEEDTLLKRRIFECEGMPDVAANSFPLIFGNMSGYTIVERMGLSIMRFQDSGTGINKVEIQVRRRIGGRLTKPWLFRVLKVAAA